jgi:Bacteriophage related domain of unknown function
MGSEEAILRALQGGVTAAVAASSTPALPVSYVGVGFTIPNDQKWLELVWLPNNIRGDLWGNEKNHRGILRILLHWPNDGGGAYKPLAVIESVGAYFTNGLLLSNVQIYSKSDLTGVLQDGDDVIYPLSIWYQSYRKV